MGKKKEFKTERIELRLSVQARAKIEKLAELYAGGNISKWVEYASLNAPRKIIDKKSARVFTRAETDTGKKN